MPRIIRIRYAMMQMVPGNGPKLRKDMDKIVLIPDSFKGTMSSSEVIAIMKERILRHHPDCSVVSIPVADGGEGSVDSFLTALGGEKIKVRTRGPWNEEIESFYGMLPDSTAVIEMAASAGLPLVRDRKDPSQTTTYGVGELILDAARRGARRIVMGLGGSATNDAGCGAAAACGVRFLDNDGNPFLPTGGSLDRICHIDLSTMDERVKALPVTAMCDIDNPFYGPAGAAAIYGPQKGAGPEMVGSLDRKMKHLASIIRDELGIELQEIPGSGAAGGMGGGMKAFFSARLQMGIETVLEITGFEALAEGADMIFTGEGRIDSQSLRGKVVTGVARRAKKMGIPVVAVVGDIGDDIDAIYDEGVAGIFSINRVAVPYEEARLRAQSDMRLTMDNILRFIDEMRKLYKY